MKEGQTFDIEALTIGELVYLKATVQFAQQVLGAAGEGVVSVEAAAAITLELGQQFHAGAASKIMAAYDSAKLSKEDILALRSPKAANVS